jgi:hypothetical protein
VRVDRILDGHALDLQAAAHDVQRLLRAHRGDHLAGGDVHAPAAEALRDGLAQGGKPWKS